VTYRGRRDPRGIHSILSDNRRVPTSPRSNNRKITPVDATTTALPFAIRMHSGITIIRNKESPITHELRMKREPHEPELAFVQRPGGDIQKRSLVVDPKRHTRPGLRHIHQIQMPILRIHEHAVGSIRVGD